ncbi:PREDICTED: uncharacterized protein LOC108575377 [Habropoda laboriosa]|uniref:uncharacterized protein LOC108575377 n=1 Tax=Habropoda laboriosa TaxID=597456 RepID=UPI00083E5D84|nr:PREDICTED: uncharacterized protein LOC108575377 [Habropoda laboriosa]
MVKLRNVSVVGRNYHAVFSSSMSKGYRRKRLVQKAMKKMLTPSQSGSEDPITPEEIGNGSVTENPRATGSDSSSYAHGTRTVGTFEVEFFSTGRTGRRNAVADLFGRHAETEIIDLPDRFEELSVETDQSKNDRQDPNSPGTSKQQG